MPTVGRANMSETGLVWPESGGRRSGDTGTCADNGPVTETHVPVKQRAPHTTCGMYHIISHKDRCVPSLPYKMQPYVAIAQVLAIVASSRERVGARDGAIVDDKFICYIVIGAGGGGAVISPRI